MKKRLTLTVEDHVIQQAKEYAEAQQESVSALFEAFVMKLQRTRKNIPKNPTADWNEGLHPDALRLYGIFKTDGKDYDYKKVLEEEITKKYGS